MVVVMLWVFVVGGWLEKKKGFMSVHIRRVNEKGEEEGGIVWNKHPIIMCLLR